MLDFACDKRILLLGGRVSWVCCGGGGSVSLIETNNQILHSFNTEYDEHVFRIVMVQSSLASQCHNYNLFNNIFGQIFRIVRKMVAVKSVPDLCVLKEHIGSATAAMIFVILFFKRL